MDSHSRFSIDSGTIANLKFTESLALIKELMDHKFTLYQASQLTNVSFDNEYLDSLENTLVDRISGCSKAEISIINNGNRLPLSLMVSLSVEKTKDNNRKTTSEYKCIFGSTSSMSHQGNIIKLPLLFVLSGWSHINEVHPVLESTFGCVIAPLKVDQPNLIWLIGISINEINKRNIETELSLVYEVKPGMTFSCNLPYGELHYLWRTCKNSSGDTLKRDELEAFFNMLTSHFENAFKIKVHWFKIVNVLLSKVSLRIEKEIGINAACAPLLYCILSFIESNLIMAATTT